MIWRTTPMQQRSKSGFIRDWLSATAAPPETYPIYTTQTRSRWNVYRSNRRINRRNNNGVIAKPASVKVEIATSGSVALLAMTIHLRAVAIPLSLMA